MRLHHASVSAFSASVLYYRRTKYYRQCNIAQLILENALLHRKNLL